MNDRWRGGEVKGKRQAIDQLDFHYGDVDSVFSALKEYMDVLREDFRKTSSQQALQRVRRNSVVAQAPSAGHVSQKGLAVADSSRHTAVDRAWKGHAVPIANGRFARPFRTECAL